MNVIDAYNDCAQFYYAVQFIAKRDRVRPASVILRPEFEEALPIVTELSRVTTEIRDLISGPPPVDREKLDGLRSEYVACEQNLCDELGVSLPVTQGIRG